MSKSNSTSVICPQCGATVLDEARFCGMCGSAVVRPSEHDPYAGELVAGRYKIQRRIASGGMGQVYVAQHETLEQQVAVKLLHRRYASDEKVVARFFNEARSYCRVKHPHAVGILDFGRLNDGTLYLVTEFVDGVSLTKLVATDGPLGPALVVRLGRQLAEVLSAAHAEQIVHRDLKPDNVMVTEGPGGRYTIKILDFGIAKILNEDGERLTRTGSVFGTPEYMSPEQAQGKQVDLGSDVYSLGALLFFMAAGHPPFQSEKRTDLLQRHISEPPPLDELAERTDMPKALVGLIGDLLEKAPVDRPADMLAVLARLESIEAVVPDPTPKKTPAVSRIATAPTLQSPARPEAPTSAAQPEVTSEAAPPEEEETKRAVTPAAAGRSAEHDTQREDDRQTRRRDDTPSGEVERIGEAGLAEALASGEHGPIDDDSFVFDLSGDDAAAADEGYTWGDDDTEEDSDDPFKQTLDVGSDEVPLSALDNRGSPVPWIIAVLVIIAGAVGGYLFVTSGSSEQEQAVGSGSAVGTGTPASIDAGGLDTGAAGATDGDAGPGVAAASPDSGTRGRDRGIDTRAVPPVPDRAFDLVEISRLAGQTATLLNAANVDEAASTWGRAEPLIEGAGLAEVSLPVAATLERAEELIATARAALDDNQCRRADRAIVEMREISPTLRRRFLGDLHDCNRRREDARGRPPRTLE